ncbi:MAG: SDR family oxidoreductase, partial [Chloroflexi bacterium]|nr:SDR family oxidoreductase [Chloroflexota bacterium]
MPADLSDKRCIVTGGATGIGRASAIRLAELGGQVAIFDNNNEDGNNTAIEINDNGGNCRFWSVD